MRQYSCIRCGEDCYSADPTKILCAECEKRESKLLKPYKVYINLGTEMTADWRIDREYDDKALADRRLALLLELKQNAILKERRADNNWYGH